MSMRHAITALTISVCGLSTVVLAVIFTLVGRAQNGQGSYAILGVWASLPYLALALMSLLFCKYRATSIVVAFGSLAIITPGLYAIYCNLSGLFQPLPPGYGNCFGPVVEVGVPVIQWVGVSILGMIASGVARWAQLRASRSP